MRNSEETIEDLLQARSEIDQELGRHKTNLTVLFTDIVGSTNYFDRFGDTAGLLLLHRHDNYVSSTVAKFTGTVIKTIGDSVMAEFPRPLLAVRAAMEIQRRLLSHNQNVAEAERLQIRIGINCGVGFRRGGDLFGDTINIAARITKLGGPDQILISQSVQKSISETEIRSRPLGRATLDGKVEPEQLYEVLWRRAPIGAAETSQPHEDWRASLNNISSVLRGFLTTIRKQPHSVRAVAGCAVLGIALITAGIAIHRRSASRQEPVAVAPEAFAIQAAPAAPPEAFAIQAAPAAPPEALATPAAPKEDTAQGTATLRFSSLFDSVAIPGGVFMMGNDDGKGDERPQHRVKLKSFRMSRSEVTNRQYLAFLEDSGYQRPKDPVFAKNYLTANPNLPVVNVSYEDAIEFCKWATRKFGATVRLPTEAEWEYASRGGPKQTTYPWGMESPRTHARYKGNASRGIPTVERTAFAPNGFGLYNMSGNVSEWVADFYARDYYQVSPIKDPAGPAIGSKRVIRGGSWADNEPELTVTRRGSRDSANRRDDIGFRIVIGGTVKPSN
jgi:sulfatase modifying factor 1